MTSAAPTGRALLPVSTSRQAAGLAWALLLRRRAAFVGCLLTFSLAGAAGLVAPLMLGRIVDVVSTGGEPATLVRYAAAILLATVVAGLATVVSIALLARAAEPALADLREQVLDRSLHLDAATLEAAGSGDLLSRVGDDVRLVSESITATVPLILGSSLAIAFTAVGLFGLDWRLGLAGLSAAPFYLAGLRWYLPRSGPFYRREREANGDRAQALLTGIHSSRTLRAHGLAGAHQEVVDAASWRSAQLSIDVQRLLNRFGARGNRAELIGLLLLLVTGFFLVRAEASTVGAVTSAALLFHRLFNPIGAVLFLFDQVQSAGASLTRLVGLARLPARTATPGRTAPTDAALSVRGLRHTYAAGAPAAVDGLDLALAPGERVAVVGASGAGKTTLGAVVAGRVIPTAGRVLLGGVDLADLDTGDRLAVALVSQEVHVFSGTVGDNLLLARPDASPADQDAALDAVGAAAWVAALPDGLATVVGDGALSLGPARAQQLALARVLLADPLVVVLDEATAEAGSAGARDLESAALAVTVGRTTLTVAHRLTQARTADRVVVLHQGRIVEQGPHDELVARAGVYAALWAAWSQ